jgi:hypothetical protein
MRWSHSGDLDSWPLGFGSSVVGNGEFGAAIDFNDGVLVLHASDHFKCGDELL